MGELLFATTCVPDESCDDSWFLSLYFVAVVIVVVTDVPRRLLCTDK